MKQKINSVAFFLLSNRILALVSILSYFFLFCLVLLHESQQPTLATEANVYEKKGNNPAESMLKTRFQKQNERK